MSKINRSSLTSLILIIIASAFILYAHNDGIKGRTRKSDDKRGCTCHGSDPTPSVYVVISGPDTLTVNQEATYKVVISGGPLTAAGTNIAVSKGTLAPLGSDLKLLSGELTHTDPKKPAGNSVKFEFTYKAPSNPGNQTMFANGNSVNLNDKKTGDKWNFAPDKTIVIRNAK
jgi:hypothetical protein